MPLRPLGARLTAGQVALGLTNSDDFRDLSPEAVDSPDLSRWQPQAVGGVILGAVSDDQDFQPPGQPTAVRPIRVPPIGPNRWAIEAAVLLQTADTVPAVVPNTLQQDFCGLPGVKEHRRGATAQRMAGIAAPLEREARLRRPALVPQA